ncbi:TadE/TadG family type IV pilus assembly protein [Phenylobacterium sp.]|jgi:Flp pilus assembly protein TadG|uniref:TadE/TadG family type IV pilus assembly protein n=1 Tax=Phenylobacterium sp. TaxID=1871053 RepID=UPI003783C754
MRRLWSDRRGVAAVEFVLLLPMLLTLYLGSVEVFALFGADRRAAHLAAAMADVTAQSRSLSNAELTDILAMGAAMMHPEPAGARLQQRITSLVADDNGRVTPDWSVNRNFSGAAPTLPAGYLAPGESAIVAEVRYGYQTVFGLTRASLNLRKSAAVRPRLSDRVAMR